MNQRFSRTFTPQQALPKAKHFCAYQERSHSEVKEKLYGWGLRKTDVESIICQLIEENYLNEERFAIQFAGGKFRMKKWGRIKIAHALQQKKVSAYNIRRALDEIDETAYQQLIRQLALDKWRRLKDQQHIVRQAKTRQFLLQRGFEPALINAAILDIRATANPEK